MFKCIHTFAVGTIPHPGSELMSSQDHVPSASTSWTWARVWALSIAVSIGIGVLEAVHAFVGYNLAGQAAGGGTMPVVDPVTFAAVLSRALPSWICAGLIVPGAVLIARRFPLFPRVRPRHLLVHLGAAFGFAALFVIAASSLRHLLFVRPASDISYPTTLLRYYALYYNLFFVYYWTIVGVTSALGYYREARQHQVEKRRFEGLAARARLDALRRQLHPHFLFNLLNAIVPLILEGDRRRAVRAISDLSELLRVSLSREQPFVQLRDELAFLNLYVGLHRLRLEDQLRIEERVVPEALDVDVPTFLFQPLIENAIEHGVALIEGGGTVEIEAGIQENRLQITVTNPVPRDPLVRGRPGGIGVANTRERIARSYAGLGTFDFSVTDGTAIARVSLPLNAPLNQESRWTKEFAHSS